MQPKPVPTTDDEWTIHSLNIQGTFFERKCRDVIANFPGWRLLSPSYPVEFPVTRDANNANRSKASNLDIWAEWKHQWSIYWSLLLVECKKCNPEFVDWIFFRKSGEYPTWPKFRVHIVDTQQDSSPFTLLPLNTKSLILADDARETRGDYLNYQKGDKTKTSTTAITEAAFQITLATQFMMDQERRIKGRTNYEASFRQIFWPMIVTTANIFTCDFAVDDVDLRTGELAFDKVKLNPHPYLLYDYPVPYALQYAPEDMSRHPTRDTFEEQAHMPILVVQSESLPDILEKLQKIQPHSKEIEWPI